jgi:aspartate racemase
MRLISAIKAGDKSSEVVASMRSLADGLAGRGAQAIVAGCTEVPLVLDDSMLEVPVISSTELLARATVRHALA